jgi:2-oxoglutarate ferredoxin oxidoreductase subunit alpha
MNSGQMLDDVRLAVMNRVPIRFYGRLGGVLPFADELLAEIEAMVKKPPKAEDDPAQVWLQHALAVK